RVAERAIGGGDGGGDHEAQAIDGDGDAVPGAQEFGEADLAQAAFEQVERVVGQENGGLFGDVIAQKFGVKVVVVQMGDEEVVGIGDPRAVDAFVAGEGEPRGEIGTIEPRVSEYAAVARLDEESGMANERYPHAQPSFNGLR